uniref:Uncharacterized protein n=1 Tax=Globodera rostochiensis TaxID=31243 RepID=A0A914HWF2_GLORO
MADFGPTRLRNVAKATMDALSSEENPNLRKAMSSDAASIWQLAKSFTQKNGQRLKTAGFCVDFGVELFPCVSLFHSDTKLKRILA